MKPAIAILLVAVAAIAVTGGIECDRVRRDAPCRTAIVDPYGPVAAPVKAGKTPRPRQHGPFASRVMAHLSHSRHRIRIGVRIRPLRLPRIESPFRRHPDAVLRKPDARPTPTLANSMPSRVNSSHATTPTARNDRMVAPAPAPPASPAHFAPISTACRFGVAHTSVGETALTYDLVHRDVAVNPLGFRVKVGEWGGGVFVSKRIGKGSGFDVGPQVNYQAGRTFVGVGYEVRNRAVVGMVGTKF